MNCKSLAFFLILCLIQHLHAEETIQIITREVSQWEQRPCLNGKELPRFHAAYFSIRPGLEGIWFRSDSSALYFRLDGIGCPFLTGRWSRTPSELRLTYLDDGDYQTCNQILTEDRANCRADCSRRLAARERECADWKRKARSKVLTFKTANDKTHTQGELPSFRKGNFLPQHCVRGID